MPETPEAQPLRLLRAYLGCTQAEFAAKLGISPQRCHNFENGFLLSKEVALKLVNLVPGLTTDWLWFGKTEGLTLSLAIELEGLSGTRAGCKSGDAQKAKGVRG
jgi:transcriptional regulator with XRE-family HTH domain